MSMRLQEIHPALVHFPIALLPVSLGADALGWLTGSDTLLQMGRRTMPLAAASAALAGAFGLVAQEAVEVGSQTHDYLVTHRNLNLGLIGLTAAMAADRARRDHPNLAYLLVGAAGIAAMTYSAYLGGHMVYEHGVGVAGAGGLREDKAPEIRTDNLPEVAQVAREHLVHGTAHALKHLKEGEIAPLLTQRSKDQGTGSGGSAGQSPSS